MNEEKISRDEVPQCFNDWLLQMGCPPEKVPSLDKMAEMCRGQYYMVWRSLMEHVRPKDIVKQQRLQVFYDDMEKCIGNNKDRSVIVPKELAAWRQHYNLKQLVESAEVTVCDTRNKLEQITTNVSKKLAQRNMSKRALQDAQRRVWFLQTLEEELMVKRDNLNETLSLARELSQQQDAVDIQNKLDICLSSVKSHLQSSSASVSATHPVASSSVMSNNSDTADDYEEQLSEVVCGRGDVIWKQVYDKRSRLVETLSNRYKLIEGQTISATYKITPEMVLTHTCSLYCQLGLETMKNKLLFKQTQNKLATALSSLNDMITEESREALVLKCEQSEAEARLGTLKKLLDDVISRSGAFETSLAEGADGNVTAKHIAHTDRNIVSKKDNIKNIISNMATTENKIKNVRRSLVEIFEGLQKDVEGRNSYGNKVVVNSMSAESVTSLVQYFQSCNEKRMARVELSLNLDNTEGTLNTSDDTTSEVRFADELRLYLKKFHLERNRKLVLESGEKIWAFETLQASADRILTSLINEESPCHLICPSVSVTDSLTRIADAVQLRDELAGLLQAYEGKADSKYLCFDLDPYENEEATITDKIKKRLNDCLISLSKSNKALNIGCENIKLWRENEIKCHISEKRILQGRCYEEWEKYYLQYLNSSLV